MTEPNISSKPQETSREVRLRLVEAGGRLAHDLGFGRLMGQILVYLYLNDGMQSLDQIEEALGLSKASTSGVTRQLETLGLLKRCWRQGDRKVYYRTADNLGEVFRDGLAALIRRKVVALAAEMADLDSILDASDGDPDVTFLSARIRRATELSNRAARILNSRILRFFAR